MHILSPTAREAIRRADEHVRNKSYPCLIPGCNAPAVRCHGIPRSLIIEALAEQGVVYTQRPSFSSVLKKSSLTDPADVVKVGLNDASVFKGFCATHDAPIFAPAEKAPLTRKGMVSLYVRALSLEYCRKRATLDHWRRLAETSNEFDLEASIQGYTDFCALFYPAYFRPHAGEYAAFVVTRNLQVSCCGRFGAPFHSTVGFNVVSYKDMTIVALNTFKGHRPYLDAYLKPYERSRNWSGLVNDLAFSKCEEPLISPRLWNALTEDQKHRVGVSLLPPALRRGLRTPQIVKFSAGEVSRKLTPAMISRLGVDLIP